MYFWQQNVSFWTQSSKVIWNPSFGSYCINQSAANKWVEMEIIRSCPLKLIFLSKLRLSFDILRIIFSNYYNESYISVNQSKSFIYLEFKHSKLFGIFQINKESHWGLGPTTINMISVFRKSKWSNFAVLFDRSLIWSKNRKKKKKQSYNPGKCIFYTCIVHSHLQHFSIFISNEIIKLSCICPYNTEFSKHFCWSPAKRDNICAC